MYTLVQQVLDVQRVSLQCQSATLYPQNVCPPGAQPPYQFVSASPSARRPEVRNVSVCPSQRAGFSRVHADVFLPVELCFTDAAGRRFTGQEAILVPMDCLMRVPDCTPYSIEALGVARIASGESAGGAALRVTFSAEVCLYVATLRRGEGCLPACPPGCACPRCRCSHYFRLPLYPQ